jgi:hypothetical protein
MFRDEMVGTGWLLAVGGWQLPDAVSRSAICNLQSAICRFTTPIQSRLTGYREEKVLSTGNRVTDAPPPANCQLPTAN